MSPRVRGFPRRRRWWGIAAAALLVAGVTSGCTPSEGAGPSTDFLRIGTIAIINSLNPWVTTDQLSLDIQTDIYPKLIQYNLTTLKLEPGYATAWHTSNGGKEITFDLHPGAVWSDGRPLTASDVAWTINTMVRLQNGAAAAWASAVAGVERATVETPDRVAIIYRKAAADALSNLEQVPILPEHIWAHDALGNGKALTFVLDEPTKGKPVVGAGPFLFVKYVPNQVLLLTRNPTFFGPRPHIAGFGIELFSNDDALVAAMTAHTLDAAMGDPNLPPTDIRPLARAHFKITKKPSVAFNDLIIDTNPKKVNHRELLNPLVREAFEYATNRTQIDNIAYLGFAQPGSSIIPPSTGAWYDPAVRPLPFDLAKANQLLDQAGYPRGSHGIRRADGHAMSYTVLLSPDNGGEGLRTGEIMTADFLKIGVKLSFETVDDDALQDELEADKYRKFDLGMWGWDTFIDPTYMLDNMTCSQYYSNSDSGYCNAAYDHLFAEQETTLNVAKRVAIVDRMQQMIYNARPYIVLQYLDVLEAWSPVWSDITLSPDGWLSQLSYDPQLDVRLTK
jgi:peptide/nickel transport system substrate-binding protein